MAITILQSTDTNANGPMATMSISYSSAITAGSLLICSAQTLEHASATLSIADDRSQTWLTAVTGTRGDPANAVPYIFYFPNAAGGATQVSVSSSPSSVIAMHLFEVSGIATASPLDDTTHGAGTAANITPGDLVTTTANQLLFAAGVADGGEQTAATSWTFHDSANYWYSSVQTRIVSSAGTYSTTFAGPTGNYRGVAASFKAADEGPPPGPQPVIFTSIGV